MKFDGTYKSMRLPQRKLALFLRPPWINIALTLATLLTCSVANASSTKNFVDDTLSLSPIITDLSASWAINVGPDNLLYVTHRSGQLSTYSLSGELLTKIDLQLNDLYYAGQGGLSAIAFHPNFDRQPWIYLSYSYGSKTANGLKVIRVLLKNSKPESEQLANPSTPRALNVDGVAVSETIFEQADLRSTAAHYGARLAFMADSSLLISTGDGFDYREHAQKRTSDMGKILRLTDTGEAHANNPFMSDDTFSQRAVYSFGHRNPQGLIVLSDQQIVAHEHGPAGGDEINLINSGVNYGWPVITQGKDYIGSLISPFTEYDNMEQPAFNWTPSIAPSGMIFYNSEVIPDFSNRLLLTSLKYQQLHSLVLNNEGVTDERIFFANSGYRMRDITMSKDGRVFILGDGDMASVFEVVMH